MEAVRRGRKSYGGVVHRNTSTYRNGIFNHSPYDRTERNGALFEEFKQIDDINNRILNGEPLRSDASIRLHLIKPDYRFRWIRLLFRTDDAARHRMASDARNI